MFAYGIIVSILVAALVGTVTKSGYWASAAVGSLWSIAIFMQAATDQIVEAINRKQSASASTTERRAS